MTGTRRYDVFLSYSSADLKAVEAIARRLQDEAKLRPFFDKWHLIPGYPWQEELEKALESAGTCAVFIGPEDVGPWQNEEVRSALNDRVTRPGFRVIPVLLPGAMLPQQKQLPRFLARLTWVDFRGGLQDPEAFDRLVAGIRGNQPGPWASHRQIARQVCFISSEYPPRVEGGLGIHVKELTRALAAHVAVDVVLPSNKRAYERLADRVNPVGLEATEASYNDPLSWLRFAKAAADRVAELSPAPDVLHCHDWVTVLAGIQARWKLEAKARTRIPLVYHLHLPNQDPLCRLRIPRESCHPFHTKVATDSTQNLPLIP
jgi:TIR domain/Glycosyl transferase 4-like domain